MMTANDTPRAQEFNLRDYWQILVRRRSLIYVSVLVATLAAIVSSWLATPTYRATCEISIERQGVRVLKQDLTSAEPSWLDYQNFYNTQYRILESDAVLRIAVEKLGLFDREVFEKGSTGPLAALGEAWGKLRHMLSRSTVPMGGDDDDKFKPYLKLLHGGLSVDPVRDSHLVDISYVHRDRKFAAEVANAIATAYIDFCLGERGALAKQSEAFLQRQVAGLRGDLSQANQGLLDYAKAHGIVAGDTTDAAMKNLEEIRNKKTQAEVELSDARARLTSLSNAPPDSLDEVRNDLVVQRSRTDVLNLERDYREASASYGSEYWKVRAAKEKLDQERAGLARAVERVAQQTIAAARTRFEQKQAEVQNLSRLYDNTYQAFGQFRQDAIEYLQRKQGIDQMEATLKDLLTRQNDMQQAGMLQNTANNVRVIDTAMPPDIIFKPKKTLNVILGFVFGLFLGVGAAVLMEYVDNTLKTPDDIRDVLGLSVLGLIPAQRANTGRKQKRPEAEETAKDIDPALITALQPLSPISEAYRELRTAVLLATAGHPPRDLCITSCQPSEGKTTTALNLAIALSQLGRRVLLVDTDLRRPRCHHVLRVAGSRGVSTALTGLSDLNSLIQPTSIERLSIVPAGPIPPNPAELLDSDRFRELVAQLRAHTEFDHIIYDSPPVLSVVDPLLIGRHTEGTVMVLKSGFTSREAGRLGKEKLLSGRLTLLGIVLNAVQTEHVPYQYRYYRYGYTQPEGDAAEVKESKRAAVGGSKG